MRWFIIISLLLAACSSGSKNLREDNQEHIAAFFKDIMPDDKQVVYDLVIGNIYIYNKRNDFFPVNVTMSNDSIAKNNEDFLIALDTVFNAKDRKYMLSQIDNMPERWQQFYFSNNTMVDTSDYYEAMQKFYKGGLGDTAIMRKYKKEKEEFNKRYNLISPYSSISTYAFSYPIFNRDKNKAIIRVSNSCGMLCGESGIILYYKVDGHWKRINHFQYSQS